MYSLAYIELNATYPASKIGDCVDVVQGAKRDASTREDAAREKSSDNSNISEIIIVFSMVYAFLFSLIIFSLLVAKNFSMVFSFYLKYST